MVSSLLENVLNFMRSNVDAGQAQGQVEHPPTPWIQNISKEVHDFLGFLGIGYTSASSCEEEPLPYHIQ